MVVIILFAKIQEMALKNLKLEYDNGKIFVTSTSKLLTYYINKENIDWQYSEKNEKIKIKINSIKDPIFGEFIPNIKDLEGFTFYVQNIE